MTGKLWSLLMSFLIALAVFGAMLVLTNLPLLSLTPAQEFGSAVPVPAALLSFVHFWGNKKAVRVRLMKVDQAGIISLGNRRQARMRLRSPWLRLELLPMGNKLLAKAIDITKKATQAHSWDLVD